MNIQELDVMNTLFQGPFVNQRLLAESCGHSLGTVNRCLKELSRQGFLDSRFQLTEKARGEFSQKAPKNAVILAAGPGIRMIPINTEVPKAFLEVHGEPLIERIIKQLHEAGIHEIYVVVGYRKEQFEYLIDEYGVRLIVNPEYAVKNNLYSLKLAARYLTNSYIIPCDIWCETNPFCRQELYSWYMVSDRYDAGSMVRINRKGELVPAGRDSNGKNAMFGIAYLLEETSRKLRKQIDALCRSFQGQHLFWEAALFGEERMTIYARRVRAAQAVEINTYEQLRALDPQSQQLKSETLERIAQALAVDTDDIVDITVLKKGMTNRSFLFSCREARYIMRIPGEGTDQLIDRRAEAAVCRLVKDKGICEEIIYLDPDSGCKITRFIEGAHTCDPANREETARCIRKLREFHALGLTADSRFDLFGRLEFYESLWGKRPSAYRDYQKTKEQVLSLRPFIESQVMTQVLTHIDAVPDNFLLFENERGEEEIRLIDWEYAGMQDPHVDLAMFSIYAMYDRDDIDWLIDEYFCGACPPAVRSKIYCYVAVCGLLWSNWCEYKRCLGVEFGEYSLQQYRYAKEYYRIARENIHTGGTSYHA